MTEGDVTLTLLPQADGCFKPRPAILLRQMPPFGMAVPRRSEPEIEKAAFAVFILTRFSCATHSWPTPRKGICRPHFALI